MDGIFFSTSWRFTSLLITFIFLSLECRAANPISLGNSVTLEELNNRKPSLFTKGLGNCLPNSPVHVTRFEAAYYGKDQVVGFNLQGHSDIQNENITIYITVSAYGERRFELAFDPCESGVDSLCPVKANTPIVASGFIPISPADAKTIPSIAMSIPDLEAQAKLQLFTESAQSEIGCYVSAVTNGKTFAHPTIVNSILLVFALAAMVCSSALAIYTSDLSSMRTHYAHSPSVWAAFVVFHHIYFTGALSLNWPSVLLAYWTNYSWFAGMIYSGSMQRSISRVVYGNPGSVSRHHHPSHLHHAHSFAHSSRAPVLNLPLPEAFPGFAGSLAMVGIPEGNAFLTGLLWFLILVAIILAAVCVLKLVIEALTRAELIETKKFGHFRNNWLCYLIHAAARMTFIGFFMLIFLAIFQLTLGGSAGLMAVTAIIFLLLFSGTWGLAGYAIFSGLKRNARIQKPGQLGPEQRKSERFFPWYGFTRRNVETTVSSTWLPQRKLQYTPTDVVRVTVQRDEHFLRKFGWLYARFKEDRWWLFSVWLVYEFIRVSILGGATGHHTRQLIGMFVVEFTAAIYLIRKKPFESARLNALFVYSVGFSKVSTTALCAAFHPQFALDRITATIIGIVVIIIQALLTICLIAYICAGVVTSYFSLTRCKTTSLGRSCSIPLHLAYLNRIERETGECSPSLSCQHPVASSRSESSSFAVHSVRRVPKIEDEEAIDLEDHRNRYFADARDKGSVISLDSCHFSGSSGHARTPDKVLNPLGGRPDDDASITSLAQERFRSPNACWLADTLSAKIDDNFVDAASKDYRISNFTRPS